MTVEKAFGQVLRIHRKKMKLSQEDLALESNLHRNYIGMLERGEKSPTLATVFLIANALNLEVEDLIKEAAKVYREME